MKKNTRELGARLAEIKDRLLNIADEAEKRESKALTDAEKKEREALMNEREVILARMAALNIPAGVRETDQAAAFDAFLREAAATSPKTNITLKREWTKGIDTAAGAPLVPLSLNDIIQPLEQGLILNTVGIKLMTGLQGDYCWPIVGAVEATVAGEKDTLTDSKIDISKLKPIPQRIGVTIPVTNQTITQTEGVALDIVRQQIPKAVARLLNRVMFCPEQYSANFTGPLNAAKTKGTFAGAIPTLAELAQMRGKVFSYGVENTGTACYVMSENMKAILEATPTQAGGGRMIVENGKIGGYPIFCTNYINMTKSGSPAAKEGVAFGIWGYEPLGQFGDTRLVIDSVTQAAQDITRITLNADWSMTTLRAEAFAFYTAK